MALNAIQPSPGSSAVITLERGNAGLVSAAVSKQRNIIKIPPVTGGGDEVSFVVVAI